MERSRNAEGITKAPWSSRRWDGAEWGSGLGQGWASLGGQSGEEGPLAQQWKGAEEEEGEEECVWAPGSPTGRQGSDLMAAKKAMQVAGSHVHITDNQEHCQPHLSPSSGHEITVNSAFDLSYIDSYLCLTSRGLSYVRN